MKKKITKDIKAFLKISRQGSSYRPLEKRVKDFKEVFVLRKDKKSQQQASRCMDCGTPFCHWACPVGNFIPEWNEAVSEKNWQKAFDMLNATNNLPEITGRVCPALCEYGCVLGINDEAVTIRENELAIIEYAFKHQLISPRIPLKRTGKKVAVVGSGPAGLSCAAQLNYAGHSVVVFERDREPGGLLRYGIPDFKLDKAVILRRIDLLKKEGIKFICATEVGRDYPVKKMLREFSAVCLAIGSRTPRDLGIEGRNLSGIHFALEYLKQANQRLSKEKLEGEEISAAGKNVVVIGGGDTGSDCVGVANRQGAKTVTQIELLPQPPKERTPDYPWPYYPRLFKTSTSHEEGCLRYWQVLTKRFSGRQGKVEKLHCVKVEFVKDKESARFKLKEIPNTEFELQADLVILALGFIHPEETISRSLNLELDSRKNIKTDSAYMSSHKGVFCAGDARRGQSLVVWAISEGRRAARAIDTYLMGTSELPRI